ncbi:putative cyclase [Neobacillus bataviensis LMG 21833]|uniref:Putative cyclase n=1 Tax=Neobacillus bataviensis LMG 21833 TaxID=1117379 RepID=K6DRQ5_9BACI|nr:cyclase family protein [Neobacillus bataviensis]EKN70994.1 putative cyclase [Neobacillus bataviensis LMG 21833]
MFTATNNMVDILGKIKEGKVFDLGMPLKNFMPHAPLHPPFLFAQWAMHGDYQSGCCSPSNDLIVMGGHVGTHVDALGHIAKDGKIYGGIDAKEVQHGQKGLAKGGVNEIPPVICRGVLLDVAGYLGVEHMGPNEPIDAELLQKTAEKQGVTIQENDIVLVRTGWIQHFENNEVYTGHHDGCPGLNVDGAKWISSKKVLMAGADTLAFEVWPSPDTPVHIHLIAENGIPIMEMVNLEELAKEKVYDFTFIMIPLNIVGGTASPIRPIAVI